MTTDFWQRKSTAFTGCLFLGLVAVSLFVIRLAGPSNLMDDDQERPAAYVMDVVQNGNWLCQRDATGDITSKPPLYTWLAALASLPFGRVTLPTLYLPSAISTLAIAWLILAVGRARFGLAAAFWAALTYLLSLVAIKQVALARTDGLFSLTIAIAALLAYQAWQKQRGWTWFWLAAAAATLTKGPLGVVLAAGGLLAAVWEWRSGRTVPVKGPHWLGIALFLLIAGGWFALAYHKMGQPLINKMIRQEAVEAVSNTRGDLIGSEFYKPFLYFLARFGPWSLIACLGFWRVMRRPAVDPQERRFERFLLCWFLVGLVIFSMSPHQRGDLLWPLIPPAAWLGGREIARWLSGVKPAVIIPGTLAVTLGLVVVGILYYRQAAQTNVYYKRTQGMQQLAATIRDRVGEQFPLTHVDDPFALQFDLGTMRQAVSTERAAELLRGNSAAFVVVGDWSKLKKLLGTAATSVHELAGWPASEQPFVRIVSNHPRLEWTSDMVAAWGTLRLEIEKSRLTYATETEFSLRSEDPHGAVAVTNESEMPRRVRARITGNGWTASGERLLAKGETLRVEHE
ncbi:MAG TPA: glycosyltransferase family 39 protein [Verrucomicrobiae bacterium]|nr:glycosyltransferase family 39 protein [Verrucomicrobiae bacterium]